MLALAVSRQSVNDPFREGGTSVSVVGHTLLPVVIERGFSNSVAEISYSITFYLLCESTFFVFQLYQLRAPCSFRQSPLNPCCLTASGLLYIEKKRNNKKGEA